jgi:hypothetical protein
MQRDSAGPVKHQESGTTGLKIAVVELGASVVRVNQNSRVEVCASGILDRVGTLAPVPAPTSENRGRPRASCTGAKGISVLHAPVYRGLGDRARLGYCVRRRRKARGLLVGRGLTSEGRNTGVASAGRGSWASERRIDRKVRASARDVGCCGMFVDLCGRWTGGLESRALSQAV